MLKRMKIILASKSPRRKELMNLLNLEYDIIVSDADETLKEGLSIVEQSKRLAKLKAKAVYDETTGDRIIIGSDTIVVKDDEIYGKPKDHTDAVKMLTNLQNAKHQVITSLCILIERNEEYFEYLDYEITDVYIQEMSSDEIDEWINRASPYDKAGAYAIQEEFAKYIYKIDGDYSSIVGLPLNKVYNYIKKFI